MSTDRYEIEVAASGFGSVHKNGEELDNVRSFKAEGGVGQSTKVTLIYTGVEAEIVTMVRQSDGINRQFRDQFGCGLGLVSWMQYNRDCSSGDFPG